MATKSAETKQFWRKQIKKRAIQAFGNKCLICGNSFPDSVYDFHHIDPETKDFSFGGSGTPSSKSGWYDIRDELQKCILVCSNCHRIIHNEKNDFTIENKNYFNMNYYNWEDVNYIINHETLERICKNKREPHQCFECGAIRERTSKSGLCKKCADKKQQTTERPSREELKKLIRENSFTSLGEKFGVSDNAIRKWCLKENLPKSKREINSYSNEEWQNI